MRAPWYYLRLMLKIIPLYDRATTQLAGCPAKVNLRIVRCDPK